MFRKLMGMILEKDLKNKDNVCELIEMISMAAVNEEITEEENDLLIEMMI